MWYDNSALLSHNCILNFAIGNRGGGKSFNAKEWAIRGFLNKGSQFVYLRRYETELLQVKDKFFDDVAGVGHFPKAEFSVVGREFYINNRLAGYGMDLNGQHKLKSNTYPDVDKIIYDEFLIEKGSGRYLNDEVHKFLGLYETIARMREVKVLFLANATSINNPYFDYFKILPRRNSKFTKRDGICVELIHNEEYTKKKKETAFGKLISGTSYGNYMLDNVFLNDNYDFIEPMSGNSVYQFTIHYEGKSYGVYWQEEKGIFHVNRNIDSKCKTAFSFTTNDHNPNLVLFKSAKKNPYIVRLKYAFDIGRVFFDSVGTKGAVYKLFDYL